MQLCPNQFLRRVWAKIAGFETDRTGSRCKFSIVGGETKVGNLAARHQSGRQVERVQRSQRRWKRLRRTLQHSAIERNQVEPGQVLQYRTAPERNLLVVKACCQPQTLDCAQALDPNQLAGYWALDPASLS
jgi:hypothetical protein